MSDGGAATGRSIRGRRATYQQRHDYADERVSFIFYSDAQDALVKALDE